MGNVTPSSCTLEGREDDLKSLVSYTKLKAGYRLIQIYGHEKVGKSRVLKELLRQIPTDDGCKRKLLYQDFKLDVNSKIFQRSWVKQMCNSFEIDFKALENTLKQHVCELFKEWFIDVVDEQDENVLLFLDKVDPFMKSPLKDNFLDFLNMSLSKCSRLQIVLTTSIKLKITQLTVKDHEVRPLGDDAVMCLLHEVTNNYYKDCKLEDREMHNDYLEGVARLCEGRPQIAITAGVLLVEDNYFFKPRELLELMISCRRDVLSPFNCPPGERMEHFTENFKQLDEEKQTRFKRLSRFGPEATTAEDSTFAILNRENDSNARVKLFVKKLFDYNLMKRHPEDQTFELHGVVRENVLAPTESDSDEGVLIARTNAMTLGMKLTDAQLRDPRLLEAALKPTGNYNDSTLKKTKASLPVDLNKKDVEVVGGERDDCSTIYAREAKEHEEKAQQRYADNGWGKLALVETTCRRATSEGREEVVSQRQEKSSVLDEHDQSLDTNTLEDLEYDSRRTISADDKVAPFFNSSSSNQAGAGSLADCSLQPPSYQTMDPMRPVHALHLGKPADVATGLYPPPPYECYARAPPLSQVCPLPTTSCVAVVRPEITSIDSRIGPTALSPDKDVDRIPRQKLWIKDRH
ncbi:hypothetical protein MAR_017050 [Mya arenaria]|uniref:Uncharacterized protein n=1 Tax=Mya arenaria TaxID=6604 RepID=A0ABY7EE67_MYAAR|nr:uncharacterized protein LOC128239302 [Mya arenaria]WAR07092.1 hypothetical protein MAR_017050 [Mya arenaria]